jgi:hypothetical protein
MEGKRRGEARRTSCVRQNITSSSRQTAMRMRMDAHAMMRANASQPSPKDPNPRSSSASAADRLGREVLLLGVVPLVRALQQHRVVPALVLLVFAVEIIHAVLDGCS